MHFRTTFDISKNSIPVSYNSKIASVGSCFSEIIGQKLIDHKFNCINNPFGTIFNPLSIFKLIDHAITNTPLDDTKISEHQGVWSHFDLHSKHSALSKQEVVEKSNTLIHQTHEYLTKADTLIITLGSAFVYKLNNENEIVANCHKHPSTNFHKSLLSVSDIVSAFRKTYHNLGNLANIILTVSPVRHVKDSIPLNAVSKSTLRLACHEIRNEFKEVRYFPSYELILDDLRDYRFYESDLIHPNQMAQDYVWQQFKETYLNEDAQSLSTEVEKLTRAVNHRPFNEKSEGHQKFIQETIKRLENLNQQVDFSVEINELRTKLL